MSTSEKWQGQEPAWCPGCGNFGILTSFKRAMTELGLEPHQLIAVSGIGQSGKFPHYTRCNTFNGLHGRTLPVATGIRLANHAMPVAAFAGDGDCYGEGGNHWMHAMRRNINVKLFVHDNQVYGLTKGQASPTSVPGMKTPTQPMGVLADELNPVAVAITMGCGFVARGFSGDVGQLSGLMVAAFEHKGFALVDILQPCISFNRLNTYEWYRQRAYHLESDYDPRDRSGAYERSLEFGERIPTGVLYREERPTYEEKLPVLAGGPLVRQPFEPDRLAETLEQFY